MTAVSAHEALRTHDCKTRGCDGTAKAAAGYQAYCSDCQVRYRFARPDGTPLPGVRGRVVRHEAAIAAGLPPPRPEPPPPTKLKPVARVFTCRIEGCNRSYANPAARRGPYAFLCAEHLREKKEEMRRIQLELAEKRRAAAADTPDGSPSGQPAADPPEEEPMTAPTDVAPGYRRLVDELLELHVVKTGEYGTRDDPYANFTRLAQLTGRPAHLYPLERALEKLIRAFNVTAAGKPELVGRELLEIASLAIVAEDLRRSG